MASTSMVAVGGQLSLSPGIAARRSGASCKSALQCGVSSPIAARLMGSRPRQLRRTTGGVVATETRRRFAIVAKATETQIDAPEAASDFLKSAKESWAKVDDKLAIGGLGVAALILLWASTGLLAALDKLPLIPGFFEFVGLAFTGWFTYRYLLFKPDREELLKIIDEAKGKITGQ